MKSQNGTKFKTGTLLARLNDFPPFFIYYLARRHNWRAVYGTVSKTRPTSPNRPTLQELSGGSGMPLRTFSRIANKLSWDEVKVKHVHQFFDACGVSLNKTEKLGDYMRHTLQHSRPFRHLNDAQLKRFNEICARWKLMRERKSEEVKVKPLASP